jgi:hypothetical protein
MFVLSCLTFTWQTDEIKKLDMYLFIVRKKWEERVNRSKVRKP